MKDEEIYQFCVSSWQSIVGSGEYPPHDYQLGFKNGFLVAMEEMSDVINEVKTLREKLRESEMALKFYLDPSIYRKTDFSALIGGREFHCESDFPILKVQGYVAAKYFDDEIKS